MPTTATISADRLLQSVTEGLVAAAGLAQSSPMTLAGSVPVVVDMMVADADSVHHAARRMGSTVTEKRLDWFTVVETIGKLDGIRLHVHAHIDIDPRPLRRGPGVTAALAERDA